jgi:hypothetical protein
MQGPVYAESSKIPETLKCLICYYTLHEACRLKCGHVFCKTCIDKWVFVEKNKCCPLDRIPFQKLKGKIYQVDLLVEGILNNFKIYCSYRNRGCRESFFKSFLNSHKEICEFKNKEIKEQNNDFLQYENNDILVDRMLKEETDMGLELKIDNKNKEKINMKDFKSPNYLDIFDNDNSSNFLDKIMQIKESGKKKREIKKSPLKKIKKHKHKERNVKFFESHQFIDDDISNDSYEEVDEEFLEILLLRNMEKNWTEKEEYLLNIMLKFNEE